MITLPRNWSISRRSKSSPRVPLSASPVGSTVAAPGLLPYRELDDAMRLTDTGGDMLADARTGRNGRDRLVGLLRQSVFGRLAGYEDVNDDARLCRDPAMRWVVGDWAITGVLLRLARWTVSRRGG